MSDMDYPEFMRAACDYTSRHWDDDKCRDCGGTGLMPKLCCNGYDCGCLGMPVDFLDCDCGAEPPKELSNE